MQPSPQAAAPAEAPVLLTFHGGLPGSLAPFALFLAGVGWLGLMGAPDERGFWPILLAALGLGLLLARDRGRFSQTVVTGMSQPIVMIMVMAWLLAGVMGTLLGSAGFVQALVWLARQAGLVGGAYVAAAFLICCVVSTATGTSFGTILVCGPLLYPAGGAALADPVLLMAAILGGATFGDSISPISDTTIASAGTQRADIGGAVRSRLKYVLPAAAGALVLFAALGGTRSPAAVTATKAEGSARGLPLVLAPALVLWLLLRGRHLVEGLLMGVMATVALSLGLGMLQPSQLFHLERERFAARGLVVEGLERGVGVSVFTLLLVGLVATLQATEALPRLVALARRHARTARGAEAWIFGAVSGAVLLTTHSVVAILAVGDFTRQTGARFGLGAYRRANLLDVTVCTYPFLLPYFLPPILASSASASGEAFGMPRVSPLAAGTRNFYSWLLLAIVLAAITSGYGRGEDEAARSRRAMP